MCLIHCDAVFSHETRAGDTGAGSERENEQHWKGGGGGGGRGGEGGGGGGEGQPGQTP